MPKRKKIELDGEICRANCVYFDNLFRAFKKRCANPFCRYPLRSVEGINFIPEYGEVCELCDWLYYAAKRQPRLEQAHEQWKKEQARKRRVIDDGNLVP